MTTVRARSALGIGHGPIAARLVVSMSIVFGLTVLGCDDGAPPPGAGADTTAVTPPPSAGPDHAATAPASSVSPGAVANPSGTPGTVPEGWTLDPAPRPMRLATYRAAGHDETEIAVSRFGGDVGGELANVNRWRGQVGLGPIDASGLESEIVRFGDAAAPGYRVRVEGDALHQLAAGVFDPATNQTWFVRVTGAPEVIDAVEADVLEFARSISRTIAGG